MASAPAASSLDWPRASPRRRWAEEDRLSITGLAGAILVAQGRVAHLGMFPVAEAPDAPPVNQYTHGGAKRNGLHVIIPHVPRGNQLARQWQLLQLIDHPAGIAVDEAARKLDGHRPHDLTRASGPAEGRVPVL
jgi:hypothetical protein